MQLSWIIHSKSSPYAVPAWGQSSSIGGLPGNRERDRLWNYRELEIWGRFPLNCENVRFLSRWGIYWMEIHIPVQIIAHLILVLCWTGWRDKDLLVTFMITHPQVRVTFQTSLIFQISRITNEYTESGFSHSSFHLILPNNFSSSVFRKSSQVQRDNERIHPQTFLGSY